MRIFTILFLLMIYAPLWAQDATSVMQAFAWKQRVLLLFTADSKNSRYLEQNNILANVPDALAERDMVIVRALANSPLVIDNVPQPIASQAFYEYYNVEPDQFRVILIGKDSTIKLKQDRPVSAGTLFELIDAMPMRQYEMLQNDD